MNLKEESAYKISSVVLNKWFLLSILEACRCRGGIMSRDKTYFHSHISFVWVPYLVQLLLLLLGLVDQLCLLSGCSHSTRCHSVTRFALQVTTFLPALWSMGLWGVLLLFKTLCGNCPSRGLSLLTLVG